MTVIDGEQPRVYVQVSDDGARVHLASDKGGRDIAMKELPEAFVSWQLESKRKIYDAIERDEHISFYAGHLPVIATWPRDGMVPNLANKGVGFTPRDEHMDQYLNLVESAVKRIQDLPPHAIDETRELRISTAREFYAHPNHIDWRRLGLLEIFEGETFRNLSHRPLASVLWTGGSPAYTSFQVDCVVETIPPEHPRYRFSWAMRRLFEYEPFHIVQTMFPYAYTFWVYNWRDKTPKRRHE